MFAFQFEDSERQRENTTYSRQQSLRFPTQGTVLPISEKEPSDIPTLHGLRTARPDPEGLPTSQEHIEIERTIIGELLPHPTKTGPTRCKSQIPSVRRRVLSEWTPTQTTFPKDSVIAVFKTCVVCATPVGLKIAGHQQVATMG